jgi:sugar-specific transcriptional regulator TrmB
MRVVARRPEQAFAEQQRLFDEMVSRLDARYTKPTRTAEAVSVVRSAGTIRRYIEDVVESAGDELMLSLTPALLERFESALATALDRSVQTTLLVTPAGDAPDPDAFDYEAVATQARVRRGVVTPVVAVADGEYCVYATQDAIREEDGNYAVIFNRSALGFLLVGFFRTVLWTTAERLVDADREVQFPHRYATLRQCVEDVRDVRSNLYATVFGRDVLTGDRRQVRGQIATTRYSADQEVATLVLATDDGEVTVGGQVAAYEDVEAHEIRVNIGSPPDL